MLISVVIQFVAEPVVALFTHDAAVVAAGGPYLRGYILDCCFAGVHFCFSGYFCAIGRSELSFVHNITAVVLVRVPGAYLTSRYFPATLLPMGLATAAGSLLSVIICVIAFLVLRRHGQASARRGLTRRTASKLQVLCRKPPEELPAMSSTPSAEPEGVLLLRLFRLAQR